MYRFLLSFLIGGYLLVPTAFAQFTLLKDINMGASAPFTYANYFTPVNGKVVFIASSYPTYGTELWVYDPTAPGSATLLKDIYPGSGDSYPDQLTVFNNKIYFTATDPTNGYELWVTDGTPAGTVLVKDINPGIDDSYPYNFTPLAGKLYFSAYDNTHGGELWVTDGTSGGTSLVTDLNPGLPDGVNYTLTAYNGRLYFGGDNGAIGTELWSSDGTAAGTTLVKDINPTSKLVGGVLVPQSSYPDGFTLFNGKLYFAADDGSAGRELWVTDGTGANTLLLADIYPGTTTNGTITTNNSSYPGGFTVANSTLFFYAIDAAAGQNTGEELYKTDGTTTSVIDISPGTASSYPFYLTALNSTLYFAANDGTTGTELWSSDGSSTTQVKDIYPGAQTSNTNNLVVVGTELYFEANDGTTGTELWKSDGTGAGTALVKDINPGASGSYPNYLTAVGSQLYLSAYDGHGFQFVISDGTAAGTTIAPGILTANGSSNPNGFIQLGGRLFFTANDGINGGELWVTDGVAGGAGTTLFADINPGAGSSFPSNYTLANGKLYFNASDGTHGTELWVTDGVDATPAHTYLVKDINPGLGGSYPNRVVAGSLNTLFFTANDGSNGTELWTTDGTSANTQLLKDIAPGVDVNGTPKSSNPYSLTYNGTNLFFGANDGVNGTELWVSDGTSGGTNLLLDIYPGTSFGNPYSSNPTYFALLGTQLYFNAYEGTHGAELWTSDGTAGGTTLVKDINPGTTSSYPGSTVAWNSKLYFNANDGTNGSELWVSDGTTAGTTLLKDINPGPASAYPNGFTPLGGWLYFPANNGSVGVEPWITDGTTGGTLLYDINPGPASSNPNGYIVVNMHIYARADDGTHGIEIWGYDPLLTAPVLAADVAPGISSSNPNSFASLGTNLYFSADNNSNIGTEPWVYDATTPLPVHLLRFTAQREKTLVHLNWLTASEENNNYFEVQRADAYSGPFQVLGKVKGNGTTLITQAYDFYDSTAHLNRAQFYRLRQVDFDGAFSYSEVEEVQPDGSFDGPVLLLYPNPTHSSVSLIDRKGILAPEDLVTVLVVSPAGVPVYGGTQPFAQVAAKLEGALQTASTGVYVVQITCEKLDAPLNLRLVKQ